MNKEQSIAENALNKRYSRFRVQIYFKNRIPITHYGHERVCSAMQINWGRVKEIVLDRERGLKNCEDRILLCSKLYGPFTTAIIYDRLQEWNPIKKIVGDNIEFDKTDALWGTSPKKITCIVDYQKQCFVPLPDFKAELETILKK